MPVRPVALCRQVRVSEALVKNPWHELLLKLGSMEKSVVAHWSMSNGSDFLFAVPKAASIQEDSFSSDIEFPFTFSEICSIRIPRTIGKGSFELRNDLDSIYDAISSIPGVAVAFVDEWITISQAGEPSR